MPRPFFTSDTHFGHKNIIKYQRQRFASIDEMDAALIEAWNYVVTNDDTVYHLGDVAMCGSNKLRSILWQLKGKIHLIRGNHDHGLKKAGIRERFETVRDFAEIKLEGAPRITLCHFPLLVWNESHFGSWHLHGHSHGSCIAPGLRLDVGVDSVGFNPIDIDAVQELMLRKKIAHNDYHRERIEPTSVREEACAKCGMMQTIKKFEHTGETEYIEHPEQCIVRPWVTVDA